MPTRNLRLKSLHVFALVAAWEQDIDTIWSALTVGADPLQLDIKLFRGEQRGPEDTDATGPANGGNDVATMTEREDWVLDPEKLGDSCTHDQAICSLDAD